VVALVEDRDHAASAIRRFLEDDTYREDAAARGIARVIAGHTYAQRVHEVCSAVGLSAA
jgi:hypothetical protein